jgi:hypothetical protein
MNRDPKANSLIMAQGLAAVAYFFCVHGAHGATFAKPAPAVTPAHSAVVAVHARRS